MAAALGADAVWLKPTSTASPSGGNVGITRAPVTGAPTAPTGGAKTSGTESGFLITPATGGYKIIDKKTGKELTPEEIAKRKAEAPPGTYDETPGAASFIRRNGVKIAAGLGIVGVLVLALRRKKHGSPRHT